MKEFMDFNWRESFGRFGRKILKWGATIIWKSQNVNIRLILEMCWPSYFFKIWSFLLSLPPLSSMKGNLSHNFFINVNWDRNWFFCFLVARHSTILYVFLIWSLSLISYSQWECRQDANVFEEIVRGKQKIDYFLLKT